MKTMRALIIALLLSLCTGCMFEAQRAVGCNNVGIFGCKDKAQPRTPDDGPPLRKAEGRTSVLTNSRGERYRCLPEQRNIDGCTEIYQPVCATVVVQCVTAPCDPVNETLANSCKACVNSLVSTYTKGECSVDQ